VRVKIFGHLIGEVIRTGLCTFCGACIASCPVVAIGIKDETPSLMGRCVACGYCYNQCPKTQFDWKTVEKALFEGEPNGELGYVRTVYAARAVDKDILKVAQDGGAVTAILNYAIDKGLIDCAVVTGRSDDEHWKPKPFVAFNKEDLIKAAGSKYTSSPALIALASAVEEYDAEKIGVVGVGCQVRAIRKMQYSNYGYRKYGSRVKFAIGLFCSESFYYGKLVNDFLAKYNVDLSKVTKFEIAAGHFIVRAGDEVLVDVPVKEVKKYARSGCEKCGDFTAELADISVGGVDSPTGWSTVIVRTSVGEELLEGAVKAGYLEVKPMSLKDLKIAKKLAKMKKKKATEAEAQS